MRIYKIAEFEGGRDWSAIDWSKSNEEIAKENGLSARTVRSRRREIQNQVPVKAFNLNNFMKNGV